MPDEPLNPTKKALWSKIQEAMAKAESGGGLPASPGPGAILQGSTVGTWDAPVAALPSAAPTAQLTSPTWDPVAAAWVSNKEAWATQAAWKIDSVNGDDAAAGTPAAPIKTLAELGRRLNGATLQQNTAVTLAGDFSTETLDLRNISTAPGTTLAVAGETTQLYAGTITASANPVPGISVGTFTDAAIGDVSPYVNKRMRLTAGASAGATAWILHQLAPTQAQVSKWRKGTSGVNATLDTYVIETLPPVREVVAAVHGNVTVSDIDCLGNLSIQDVQSVNTSGLYGCSIAAGGLTIAISSGYSPALYGCHFMGTALFIGAWAGGLSSTAPGVTLSISLGALFSVYWSVLQGSLELYEGAVVLGNTDLAIVNSAKSPAILLQPNTNLYLFSGTMWGATTGALGVSMDPGSQIYYTAGAPNVVGATHDLQMNGSYLGWASTPIALDGAQVVKKNARVPDALEVAVSFDATGVPVPVTFPAGVVLNTAAYKVEFVELAPVGGTPAASSGPWPTALGTGGFTANIGTPPGAGVTRNFTARVKL